MSTQIIRNSILALQVCSDEQNIAKLTQEVNELNLAGTTNGWQLDEAPKNPSGGVDPSKVPCADGNGRYHYVFVC